MFTQFSALLCGVLSCGDHADLAGWQPQAQPSATGRSNNEYKKPMILQDCEEYRVVVEFTGFK